MALLFRFVDDSNLARKDVAIIDNERKEVEAKHWLKTDEAAQYASLSIPRIRELIQNGVVPAAYFGDYLADRREELFCYRKLHRFGNRLTRHIRRGRDSLKNDVRFPSVIVTVMLFGSWLH